MPYAIGSILAVIFGVFAQNQIKASGGRDGGAGLAKAGLILGCIGVGLWMLFILLAEPCSARCRPEPLTCAFISADP